MGYVTVLVEPVPGTHLDHIVIVRPNHATNIETPRTIGCDLSFIDLTFEDGFRLDLGKIEEAIRPNTRYVSVTYLHNPTGSTAGTIPMSAAAAGLSRAAHQIALARCEAAKCPPRLTRTNLKILGDWIAAEPRASYVKPRSGTPALLHYDLDMPSADLCRTLRAETGVMLLPGSVLDVEGWLCIGYASDTEVLR